MIKILLSIIVGMIMTSLIIVAVTLVVYCVGELADYIQGCIAEFRYTKSINWCQICLDIIAVISLLVTISLISAYMYFQL